ncbi:MAG: helix-turn-helix domain-containing protein [Culicoidibacterales bacterium]
MTDLDKLGSTIRSFRKQRGISQEELCNDYFTRRHLVSIEQGKARPKIDILFHICETLKISVSDLLTAANVDDYYQFKESKEIYRTLFLRGRFSEISYFIPSFLKVLEKPLPLDERREVLHLLSNAYFYGQKDVQKSIDIIRDDINFNSIISPFRPSLHESTLLSDYIRFNPDVQELAPIIDKILDFSYPSIEPYLGFAICRHYYQNNRWQELLNLAQKLIIDLPANKNLSTLTFFYAYHGVGLVMLGQKDKGVTLISHGLILAILHQENLSAKEIIDIAKQAHVYAEVHQIAAPFFPKKKVPQVKQ